MIKLEDEHGFFRGRGWILTLLAVTIVAGLYLFGVPRDPPGFHIDESSISFNAYTISQTGRDEFGIPWPLFFRAFGEYKNPVYIYLLAAVFRLTGPSILGARLLSAVFGLLTALAVGLLGGRLSKRPEMPLLAGLTTLLTPWLFELSRVVFEVAMYPLALALFLLCLHRASVKVTWSWWDTTAIAATLALLTYTYSIGRLFAPLLALGLVVFATRARVRSVLLTWVLYALTLVPALVFHLNHPGALNGRFRYITYITPQSTGLEIVWNFARHYAANLNPWRLFVSEHSPVSEIIHIPGSQPVLAATALLAVGGAFLVVKRKNGEAWWHFVFYGLAVSVVPASLTIESFHMLRLAALPVFLIVLALPALAWLIEAGGRSRRAALVALIAITLLQGLVFQYQYHRSAQTPRRLHLFDAEYPRTILVPALASRQRPIYLADAPAIPGYIQAFWYTTLWRVDLSSLRKLPLDEPPPVDALVIGTEENCFGCEILARVEPYTLYLAHEPGRPREPLPNNSFRAGIEVPGPTVRLQAIRQQSIHGRVRNVRR